MKTITYFKCYNVGNIIVSCRKRRKIRWFCNYSYIISVWPNKNLDR